MSLKRPARVLFLHPSNELYGADTSLLYLLRGLDRSRFDPYVILANDLEYSGLLSKELTRSNIKVASLPIAVARRKYLSPTGLPAFLGRVRSSVRLVAQIIEQEGIDLVHTNTLAVWTGALAAKRANRPHVWHVRESLESPKQLVTLMQRFVPSYSDRVVGVSQAVLENILVTPKARAKGVVIYNGKEPHTWMAAAASGGRDRVRHELGIGPEAVAVGMVARISTMKAPDLCVQAVTRLQPHFPQLHCFIAGGPVPGQTEALEEVERLVARAPDPSRIHLLGERRDAPDLMAAMDILAAPSRYGEGASLTIIQGMFAAKPVVASDAGGNRELVEAGRTGFLIPPEDVGALAEGVGRLIADARLRAQMGAAGQQRALQRFTLDRAVAEFNALLAEVCPGATNASVVNS
jgi:glycosyltransferase involved in cell wall biosynthesis